MNTLQASRRGFLSNLAILTAGVALGSNISDSAPCNNLSPDLEALWKLFCRQQSGQLYSCVLQNKKEIVACKGHRHQEGKAVHLSGGNIIAQPVWIYWAANKNKPSDIIVNFYRDNVAIASINQFELKALCEPEEEKVGLAAFLRVHDNGTRLYTTQTVIGPNNSASTRFNAVTTQQAFV